MNAQVPIIRAAGEGDKRSFLGGGLHTWKLTDDDTNGAYFLFEDALSSGKTTPLHAHPEADEMLYVLEGEILVVVDNVESRLGAGGMVFTPKGVPHAFLVVSDGARLLTLQTPGVGQAFYRGASEPASSAACSVNTTASSLSVSTAICAPKSAMMRSPTSSIA